MRMKRALQPPPIPNVDRFVLYYMYIFNFCNLCLSFRCPADDQTFLNPQNTWYRVNGQSNELQTGLVQLIKLSKGNSLNLHCSIKLCIVGSEHHCEPVSDFSFYKIKKINNIISYKKHCLNIYFGNEWVTNRFGATIKLSKGNSFSLQCSFKLCIVGSEHHCELVGVN